MTGTLTITLDEDVQEGLHTVIGRGRIGGFLGDLACPHVVRDALDDAYREMAEDRRREDETPEWSEGLIGDVADDRRARAR